MEELENNGEKAEVFRSRITILLSKSCAGIVGANMHKNNIQNIFYFNSRWT